MENTASSPHLYNGARDNVQTRGERKSKRKNARDAKSIREREKEREKKRERGYSTLTPIQGDEDA